MRSDALPQIAVDRLLNVFNPMAKVKRLARPRKELSADLVRSMRRS